MLATDAKLDEVAVPPALPESRPSQHVDALAELDDHLSSARGLAQGMVLGILSLAVVASAVWWVL